jgi:uncharacterized membrane protein YsdA (DUF1294 family)
VVSSRKRGVVALPLAGLFLVFVAAAVFTKKLPFAILTLYVIASTVAFIAYARDKSAARNDEWRTPESTLLLFGIIGGWPGALAAQTLLRHKSKKRSFIVSFWATVVANCIALGWLLSSNSLRSIIGVL